MIPGVGGKMKELKAAAPDEKELSRVVAIIDSMTREERDNAKIINGSRRKRVALGSGRRGGFVAGGGRSGRLWEVRLGECPAEGEKSRRAEPAASGRKVASVAARKPPPRARRRARRPPCFLS